MIALGRSVVAVVIGYMIFALSAFAIFQLSGHAPHASAPVGFMLVTIVSGVVFACAGGYVAGWIAGRHPLAHGIAVGLVLALGAGVSLVATIGHGAIWTQVAALVLMAPSAVMGGWVRGSS